MLTLAAGYRLRSKLIIANLALTSLRSALSCSKKGMLIGITVSNGTGGVASATLSFSTILPTPFFRVGTNVLGDTYSAFQGISQGPALNAAGIGVTGHCVFPLPMHHVFQDTGADNDIAITVSATLPDGVILWYVDEE